MAKYLALRKYTSSFKCTQGHVGLNPTHVYGPALVHCHCGARVQCPSCGTSLTPYRPATKPLPSPGSMMTRMSGGTAVYPLQIWSCECSQYCNAPAALGLPKPGISTPPTVMAPAATKPPAAPAKAPEPYAAEKVAHLNVMRIKLAERIGEAVFTSHAYGHSVPYVAVIDLSLQEEMLRRICSLCGAYFEVSLKEFPDKAFTGTAVTFPCAKLQKGKRP